MHRRVFATAGFLVVLVLCAGAAMGQYNLVHGNARYERIKGRPQMGHRELYETNLFLTPADDSQILGRARRLGTTDLSGSTCADILLHNGAYCINRVEAVGGSPSVLLPNGVYSMLVNESLFFVSPRIVQNVVLQGTMLTVNPELPLDYSTYFQDDWVGHVEIGDYRPASTPWYQTFVATGNSIRGVTFSYAGQNPARFLVAVLASDGTSTPVGWPMLGQGTVSSPGGGLTDNWIRFRSGEIPTVPGRQYAIRISGFGGVNNGGFQPFIRRKDGSSYVGGQAYDHNGIAHGEDLNVTVFSDNDGTRVTMNKRHPGMGILKDPGFTTRWGQSFVARGVALAGADVKAACANDQWETDFRWRVRESGPGGAQIGPSKITNPAWNAGGFHQGVSFNRGEVPLTPGQTYFIEFEAWNPPVLSPGFNPYLMENDSYAEGQAYYWNGSIWEARSADDVHMTILEYTPSGPQIAHSTDAIISSVYLGASLPVQTFTVTNAGSGTLEYSIDSDATWMVPSPVSGSSNGQADVITVACGTAGLPVGEHVGTITISGNAHNSPQSVSVRITVYSVGPDLDGDSDVDQSDFAIFQSCYSGSGTTPAPGCEPSDFDNDRDVDVDDFDLFRHCVSGPGHAADPDCL